MLKKFQQKLKNDGEVYLRIKARPGASNSEITQVLEDDTIKINIAAPAEKGKANAELTSFLAKEFKVEKKEIKIISGAGDKLKLIKILLCQTKK